MKAKQALLLGMAKYPCVKAQATSLPTNFSSILVLATWQRDILEVEVEKKRERRIPRLDIFLR